MTKPIQAISPVTRPPEPRDPAKQHAAATEPAPPAPALDQEYAVARRVMEELEASQVNLRFDVDDETHRIRIQVRGADGHVIKEIPATRLLDVLSGQGMLFDERA